MKLAQLLVQWRPLLIAMLNCQALLLNTYIYKTVWCRIFFEKLIVTQLVKEWPFFMETEGSSPCSQNPDTELYPESAESSSLHPSLAP